MSRFLVHALAVMVLTVLPTLLFSQTLHQFSWNDPAAPPTRADVGPDATSISSSAAVATGGVGGTTGLNPNPDPAPKLDFEMSFPAGPSADITGIDLSLQYNRSENSGTILVRGDFTFGRADALNVVYQVEEPGGTVATITSDAFDSPRDGSFDLFRFTYDPATGTGRLFLDGEEMWVNDGPDNQPLFWSTDEWFLGDQIDGSGEGAVVFDDLIISDPFSSAAPYR